MYIRHVYCAIKAVCSLDDLVLGIVSLDREAKGIWE
jgi:hypothetical protein